MLNRKLIATLLIAAGHCLIGTATLDAADAALKKLRIGYPSHSASMYPIYVTKEAKLLEKHGLDGEMITFKGCRWCKSTLPANWM